MSALPPASHTVSASPIGPSKAELSLPPADTKRWVMRRKAQVVAAVRKGDISPEDACTRYNISPEELQSWQKLIESHGVTALRATKLQDYRHSNGHAPSKGHNTPRSMRG
ncbi:MAG: DUF1153 domain-containing protein [Alphaproteobacteria bacterium]|nr:MAG: DUF1153 domain-containing protein [Alphaproteobacteria bacterium]